MSEKEFIGFNKPYLTGREYNYIQEAVNSRHISGNGAFTKKCHHFFENRYGFGKCFLTTSCTDALEMASILAGIGPGDEVIMPSFTFVSTANAFVLRGAKIIFCDSRTDHPGMDEEKIEALVTPHTRAIVPVHYAGVACDMDKVMAVADKHNLLVIEDAAQAIDSFYTGADGVRRALGSIGHFAAFSFHETKNITSGEGGMLVVNDRRFIERAEIIWEKGTNRAAFFRGDVDKYGWIDVGSSFLPSEIIAAFLWAQLEALDDIQTRRRKIWKAYYNALSLFAEAKMPVIPNFATNNAHMFYMILPSLEKRSELIEALRKNGIHAVFHYQSLHSSPYYRDKHNAVTLCKCDEYSSNLVRLPFFYDINYDLIISEVKALLK